MNMKYVLGFAYWRNKIALIYKTKGPKYVIDTYNAVGGKLEDFDISTEAAMAREFEEETGIASHGYAWQNFAIQKGKSWDGSDYELHMFKINFSATEDYTNITNLEGEGEFVAWYDMEYVNKDMMRLTPNLKWLIPLSIDETTGYLDIREY